MCRSLTHQRFQPTKSATLWENFSIFLRCVEMGIWNPCPVSFPEVSSFQTNFPARGWKLLPIPFSAERFSLSKPTSPQGDGNTRQLLYRAAGESHYFPNQLPRKGMETSSVIKKHTWDKTFQTNFPARGWKHYNDAIVPGPDNLSKPTSPQGDGNYYPRLLW